MQRKKVREKQACAERKGRQRPPLDGETLLREAERIVSHAPGSNIGSRAPHKRDALLFSLGFAASALAALCFEIARAWL